MSETDEGWLRFGVAAAMAQAYAADQRRFLSALGSILSTALPGQVEVVRKRSLFGGKEQVREVRVQLGDHCYVLEDRGRGPLAAQRNLVKRGIVLKSDELPVERWIEELGAALDEYARRNQQAFEALRRFAE